MEIRTVNLTVRVYLPELESWLSKLQKIQTTWNEDYLQQGVTKGCTEAELTRVATAYMLEKEHGLELAKGLNSEPAP